MSLFFFRVCAQFCHCQGHDKIPGYRLGCQNDGDVSVLHDSVSLDSETKIDWNILRGLVDTDGYFPHEDVNVPCPTAYEYRTTRKHCGTSVCFYDGFYSAWLLDHLHIRDNTILPQGEIVTHACGLELRIYIPLDPEVGKVFIVVTGDEDRHRHPVGRSVRAKDPSKSFVDRAVEASGGIGKVTAGKLRLGD
jgi:hypothetical protein